MKIYIIQGSTKVTDSTDSDNWSVTYTWYYFLEAYKEKRAAEKRVTKLQKAVALWCLTLRRPERRYGVRAAVFLKELAEKVGDPKLSEESVYGITEIELKE